ncbi:MAG: T9SS type A sorting domain-containing protein [Bacteroidota bacterium]
MSPLYTFNYRLHLGLLLFLLWTSATTNANTELQYGDDVIATLDVEGETDIYTFSGTAGDVIWIRMRDAESPIDACMELRSPGGDVIGEDCRNGGVVNIRHFTLPETGTYQIVVSDNRNNDTGPYGLALEILNSPQAALPLKCGDDLFGTIANSVEVQAYSFTIAAGEIATFRMRSANPSLESEISIYDPQGNLVAAKHSSHLARIEGFTFDQGGTYQIMVTDYNGNDTGDYGLSFQVLNRLSCIPILECGEAGNDLSGDSPSADYTIAQLAELDAYRFGAQAGDIVVVQMFSPVKGFEVSIRLYDDQGNLLTTATPDYGLVRLESEALPKAGEYVLLVCDNNGNDRGDYELFLEKVNNGGCATPIHCIGNYDGGQLKAYGAMRSYSFTSLAGSTANIVVRPLEQEGLDPRLELYDPAGQQIFDEFSYGSARLEDFVLPADGTYTVLVSDKNGNDLGDYDFEIEADQIIDTQAPVLICKAPAARYVLENGSLSIDPAGLVEDAFDACSNVTIEADITEFNCDHIGANELLVTVTDESGNTTTCTLIINIEDPAAYCVADYCEATGASASYEWIEKVSFASQGKNTGNNGGYASFTENPIPLYRNVEYGIALTPGYNDSGVYEQRFWGAWIDWNRDGDFDDEGETILEEQSQTIVKTTFTTPADAALSGIVLRVTYQYGDAPSACGSFEYGETEDFLLVVLEDPVCNELPEEWSLANIGNTPIPGSVCYNAESETYTVTGSGNDIYGSADAFYYVYQELCGDGDIVVRLDEASFPGTTALAGIMFRQKLKAGSKNISLLATKEHGILYQARTKNNKATIFEAHEGEAPSWIKLERRGNLFSGYLSKDGEEWELVCPFELNFPNCIRVGLAVSSNNTELANEAVFSQVSVIPAPGASLVNGPASELSTDRDVDAAEDQTRPATLRVFPNPAVDFVQVDCPTCRDQATTVQLFNLSGSLLWETQNTPAAALSSYQLGQLGLPSGTYLLRVSSGTTQLTQKLSIQ